ncbi:MAG: hypothetical protein HYY23_13265, partial [Verrucomicrobia bacterium]|nr:hypothetical protein [Verrucomicrobiota bacterium]
MASSIIADTSRIALWLGLLWASSKVEQVLAAQDAAPESSSVESSTLIPATHALEANSEILWSSGITLTDSAAAYRQTRRNTDLNLSLSFGTIDLAYQPADFDIISQAADLSEHRFAVQAGLKHKIAPALSLLGSGGVYDGYVNYRTLWLNEYYRQYYSDVRGYSAANPGGFNLSAGLRWEFRPATAFLQVEGIYSRDDVPSGYEIVVLPPPQIGTELVRSPDRLHTAGARLSLENVLTRRIRLLNELQIAATTDRDPRFSYQGSVNWALAEQWVLRSVAGFSIE